MNKGLWTFIGFLLFLFGIVSFVLTLVGVQSIILDVFGGLIGFLIRICMIVLGLVIAVLANTDWQEEEEA